MHLSEQIERFELLLTTKTPWKNHSHSRKYMKSIQHRAWRRWGKKNLSEDSLIKPMFNRYYGWEY